MAKRLHKKYLEQVCSSIELYSDLGDNMNKWGDNKYKNNSISI
jgi:hypothetical protein